MEKKNKAESFCLQEKGGSLVGEIQEIPGHLKMQRVKEADGNHFQLVESLESH